MNLERDSFYADRFKIQTSKIFVLGLKKNIERFSIFFLPIILLLKK